MDELVAGAAGVRVLPLILIVTRLFRNSVRESYRRVRAAIARINSFTQEHISGMSVVQLFNREERAYQDFEVVNKQHMIAFKDTIFAYALYYPAVDASQHCVDGAGGVARRLERAGHGSVTMGMLAMFIHVLAAVLAADSGFERQVQHPAGGDGGVRAHLQADGYEAGDCLSAHSRRRAMGAIALSFGTCGSRIRN